MATIRVVLADDHTLMRAGLRSLLDHIHGVEVVAEAGNGRDAVALAEEHRPDVVLMDIHLPGLSGIECLRELRRVRPVTQILMLTIEDDSERVFAALRAGAAGYLLKAATPGEIRERTDRADALSEAAGSAVAKASRKPAK